MSQLQLIKVPDIGGFADVDVIEVLVAEGDEIAAEQSLITLESDKATMEVPSPVAGIVRRLNVKLGDTVSEGSVIAEVETAGEAAKEAPIAAPSVAVSSDQATPPPAAAPVPPISTGIRFSANAVPAPEVTPPAVSTSPAAPPPVSAPPALPSTAKAAPHASPGVRKLAREWAIDLNLVAPSGTAGRITEEDLQRYRRERGIAPSETSAPTPVITQASVVPSAASLPASPQAAQPITEPEPVKTVVPPPAAGQPSAVLDFSRFGQTEIRPLGRIHKIAGANLLRNWTTIPHVTQHDEADITELEVFRKENDPRAREQGTRLTLVTFLIKAAVAALKHDPQFNSSLSADGENLILKRYYHIGIAVDTPNGLVVPVIRDCDQKGLIDLARELTSVSARAREAKMTPADMQGGCFSISSLGGIGGTAFTPIVNAPEVAILGVSRAQMKPVWHEDRFEPRLMLPLSLSYDHRVIDGAAAARFTRFIASRLEDFRRVLL